MREIQDIFSYICVYCRMSYPKVEDAYLKWLASFVKKYNFLSIFIRAIERTISLHQMDILFLDTRYLDLICRIKHYHKVGVIVQGKKDWFHCIRNYIDWFPAWKWKKEVYDIYLNRSDLSIQNLYMKDLVTKIQSKLKIIKPKLIVFWNDSLFLERAIIFAAEEMGVPTITIQHGLFMEATPSFFLDGHFTGYMLVWGEFFKNNFIDRGIIPEKRLAVLGYPYLMNQVKNKKEEPDNKIYTVCFLGQPYNDLDESWGDKKNKVVMNVRYACRALDLNLVYRPHPGEKRAQLYKDFQDLILTPQKESLEESIKYYTIFLSITSTALLEAALRGKIAVQIQNTGLPQDDFNVLGITYTINNNHNDIYNFLLSAKKGEIEPMKVNSNYIYIPPNIEKSFYDCLHELGIEL